MLLRECIRRLRDDGARPADGAAYDAVLIAAAYDARTRRAPQLSGRFERERADALRLLEAEEEGSLSALFEEDASVVPPTGSPPAVPPPAAHPAFHAWFRKNVGNLPDFRPDEFLSLGGSHAKGGLNSHPPEQVWPNVITLAHVLQALRTELGRPVRLNSVFRSEKHNRSVGGRTDSQHLQFRAADFCVPDFATPLHWAGVLKRMRANGRFSGGIGIYPGFVHVDTRGRDADWVGG